jgi:dihydroflavonol-4-reductase
MIVTVTGATGHIGANLVRALIKERRQVRALVHHDRKALEGLELDIIQGDVTDPASLSQAFAGAEVVYHLAATISLSMSSWSEVEAVNVKGTRNVVEACLKNGIRRLVHFSSIHAMVQVPLDTPVDERRPLVEPHGSPPYDRSKAAGEKEVRQGIEDGLDAVIINPTAVLGPHDYNLSHLGVILLSMARGKMPALVEGGFDWVDARDVVDGAMKAETRAPVGAKYLLSGNYASVCDLARLTEEILAVPQPRFVCPLWLARASAPLVTTFNQLAGNRQLYTSVSIRALSNCNRNISHERAMRELDYQPRSLRDTLRDTFRWFQDTGMLEPSTAGKTSK